MEISTETGAEAPNFMILVRIRNTDGRKLNLDLIPQTLRGMKSRKFDKLVFQLMLFLQILFYDKSLGRVD